MRLQIAGLYLCVSVLTFTWLVYNVDIAKHRAIPIIAACKQFEAEHNRYPTQLNELVPATLTALPNARNTLVARRFGYDTTRPALYFPAMFHGVLYYDFQTDSWTANAADRVNFSGKYSVERGKTTSGGETDSTLEVVQNEDSVEVTKMNAPFGAPLTTP